MLVVLGALIVAGFLGAGLIKMTTGGQMNNIFYASSASARSAANSGLIAAKQKLESPNPTLTIVPLLQNWIDASKGTHTLTNDDQWLTGSNISDWYDQIGTNQKYRVQIIAFDKKNFTVTLVSEGIGKGNSRAKVTSIYQIDGLYIDTKIGTKPLNALYLGSGGDRIHANIMVHGDSYMRGNAIVEPANLKPSHFYGAFRIGPSLKSTDRAFFFATHFHGPTYFQAKAGLRSHTNITDFDSAFCYAYNGIGFDSSLTIRSHTVTSTGKIHPLDLRVLSGNMYLNNTISYMSDDVSTLALDHLNIVYNGITFDNSISRLAKWSTVTLPTGIKFQKKISGTYTDFLPSMEDSPSKLNIPTLLGISQRNPKIIVNPSVMASINAVAKTVAPSQWDGNYMNTLYEGNTANKFGEWLVLKYSPGNWETAFKLGGTAPFEHKVIWIVENSSIKAFTTMYEHSDAGNSIFYIGTGGSFYRMGGMNKFRGFIFSEAERDAELVFAAEPNSKFIGGIYIQDSTGSFQLEGPGAPPNSIPTSPEYIAWQSRVDNASLDVTYNHDVMNEIRELDLFVQPGSLNTQVDILTVKPSHATLIASLVSKSQ